MDKTGRNPDTGLEGPPAEIREDMRRPDSNITAGLANGQLDK